MELWPLTIAEREAEILYPQLPEEYRKQKTKEEFIVFFEQFFILTGDLESGDKASKAGEKHGFVNDTACAFFDDDECGYVSFVSPGPSCQEYIQYWFKQLFHCDFKIPQDIYNYIEEAKKQEDIILSLESDIDDLMCECGLLNEKIDKQKDTIKHQQRIINQLRNSSVYDYRMEQLLRKKMRKLQSDLRIALEYKEKYLQLKLKSNDPTESIAQIKKGVQTKAFSVNQEIPDHSSISHSSYIGRQLNHQDKDYYSKDTDVHPWAEYMDYISDDEKDEIFYFESENAFD